ncbi:MAG: UTP--glucose-1-phosphate uridylyltransferase [Limisphaerales bacterium]
MDSIREKMTSAGVSEVAIRAFEHNVAILASGAQMMIPEDDIRPVESLPKLEDLPSCPEGDVCGLLESTVILKLNGGLGTGMGLQKAKSLLEVRDGMNFLDLAACQILALRKRFGMPLQFLLMNSFSTSEDTREFLQKYPELGDPAALEFVQSKAPKLDAESMAPVDWPADPDHEWCPPGHGDLYPAILSSGKLAELLDSGVRYAFVSNSDNLGATLNLDLLNHFAKSGTPFLMEVTRRTEADRKGGHLAVDAKGEGLLLREAAQCPDADSDKFQDIDRHRFFNTNNLWINLERLKQALDDQGGFLPLSVIRNGKTVDPRDQTSPEVIQLETAMGAAISCFEDATAVEVPRTRFAPVKTTADLLALRSDAYVVTDDFRLELHPDRKGVPPVIKLDSDHFKMVDQLEAAIADGVPSLLNCDRLEVKGRVKFDPDLPLSGKVALNGN